MSIHLRKFLLKESEKYLAEKATSKGIRWILMGFVLIWSWFPIYWMISIALRSKEELSKTLGLLPRSISLKHIEHLFAQENFMLISINSFIVTGVSMAVALAIGLSCGYILSRHRFNFKLKIPLMIWILLVRILPPITFAIPLYSMMNAFGVLNTRIPIILAHVLINLPFIIWFMITFFKAIPVELEESAKMDGADNFVLYLTIILRLALPGIVAVSIFSFMTSWNEYLYSMIFIQSPDQFTIPIKLATFNSEQELTQWGKVAGGGVLSVIPVILFAAFMQKYLISGLGDGAVKE